MCPTTIASMMLRLSMFGLTGCRLGRPASTPELRSAATQRLGWDEVHLSAPCVLCSDWERLWCCDGPASVLFPISSHEGLLLRIPNAEQILHHIQASISPRSARRDVSTGAPSIAVRLADLASPPVLLRALTDARRRGCIGVIVEIVQNQASGRVLAPHELHNLREVCKETGLLFAVDEALTAIRCERALCSPTTRVLGDWPARPGLLWKGPRGQRCRHPI